MKYFFLIIILLTTTINLFAQEEDNPIIDSLVLELLSANEDTNKVNMLNLLANELVGVDNYQGLAYAKNAQQLAHKLNFVKGNTEAYYNIGKCFYYEYEFDSLIFYYNKSTLPISLESYPPVGAKIEFIVGMVYHIQSNYGKAIYHYKNGLKINESLDNKKNSAGCLNNIGAAFYDQGDYEKALENYFKSLEINEALENKDIVAKTLANIGGIYEEQDKYDNALEYYNKAIVIASEIDSKLTIADTYRNIGGIYSERSKFDSTIQIYNKALEIYKELNDIAGIVIMYNRYGQVYNEIYGEIEPKFYDTIINYYDLSLKINRQELDDVFEKIVSNVGIGEVLVYKKQYNRAIQEFSKALNMSIEIESKDNIKTIHENLSAVYNTVGNYKKAYESYRLFKMYNDSLKNDENIEMLTQNSMQYEFDKQQKEQEFIQAQKDLEYEQKQKEDRLIRIFILAVLVIVVGFSVQVFRSYQRKKKDNELLEEKNTEIEKQKKEITDSIKYAKRIQTAILPSDEWANENLPEHFILFRPRDIVSGDYYWMNKIDNKLILIAADCTGHGVPGAFMSMLGVSFLNEIVNKNNTQEAHLILNQLRNQVKRTLGQTGKSGEAKDGMDIAICVLDVDTLMLQFAGAYNPLFLFREGELLETKGDKMPIGIHIKEKESFTKHDIQLQKGDTFYIFSDGYPDQFGGPKGGKFKTRAYKTLLTDIQPKSMMEQREILNTTIDDWRGDLDQVDDMIIIGVRV